MGRRFGDVNLDQKVDIQDFNAVATNWDPTGQNPGNGWSAGDLNGDGLVDIGDVNILVVNFAPLGYEPLGNLNNRGNFDPEDVDLWFANLGWPSALSDVDRKERTR